MRSTRIAKSELDAAEAARARLQALYDSRGSAWQQAARVAVNVREWLADQKPANCVLEPIEVVEPKLGKNETLAAAIERLQRRGRELRADIARVEAAPFPSSYAKAQMREQIGRLADRGAVNVSGLVELGQDLQWPTQQARVTIQGGMKTPAIGHVETPDTIALMAWLLKPALIEALDAAIDGESDDAQALDHTQRARKIAELQGDLLSVERDEASLIWRASAEGSSIWFRADTHPLAILSAQLVTVARAPLLDTSPENVAIRLGG